MRRSGSPTLVDVAREAGVSVSTAGRVVSDAGWPVDPALKERVGAAAARLGYVPNLLARTLRGGGSALVGLVAGDMLDPYYGEIAETVTRHAESAHLMLALVCNMQRDPLLELKYCRQLWEHRVAGLILAGGGFDQITHRAELASTISGMGRSGVVVTTIGPRDMDAATFSVDNVLVGRMAATELISHGHRHIGVTTGRVQNEVRRQRLAGIVEALTAAGIRTSVSEIMPGEAPDLAIAAMLASNPDITGLIATTHMMSMHIASGVRRSGRRVPGDVSMVAIGNARLVEWSTPRLTYIDVNLAACSRAALDYIAAKVAGKGAEPAAIGPPRLVRGESVSRV